MYICQNCGKKVDDVEKFVTCPYCGHKILIKQRPQVARKIKTD
jgi:DNA-directed RNA polymerase subunit RPC12/RpoP